MQKMRRLLPALLLVLGGSSFVYAAVSQVAADDCPSLAANPDLWYRVEQLWSASEVTAIVRHANDCEPQSDAGCDNGNEHLTDVGRERARMIGEGIRRSLGAEYLVSHSYLERTRETAVIAFGESTEEPSITKPCKGTLQDYIDSQSADANRVYVTHSSCINSLEDGQGQRMLGFSAAKKAHFAITVFLGRDANGHHELVGCVWPVDWATLERGETVMYQSSVARKLSQYFVEFL